jgi:hypothetical protein
MLAQAMEQFVNNLVQQDWLPSWLQYVFEILVYMAFLTILMMTPMVLWLGYAVSTTKRRQRQAPPPTPRG